MRRDRGNGAVPSPPRPPKRSAKPRNRKTSSSDTLTGRIWEDSMNQGTHPEGLPGEILDDVASVVGAEVTVLSRLPGGLHVGALRVQLAGRSNAVLKAVPRAHLDYL